MDMLDRIRETRRDEKSSDTNRERKSYRWKTKTVLLGWLHTPLKTEERIGLTFIYKRVGYRKTNLLMKNKIGKALKINKESAVFTPILKVKLNGTKYVCYEARTENYSCNNELSLVKFFKKRDAKLFSRDELLSLLSLKPSIVRTVDERPYITPKICFPVQRKKGPQVAYYHLDPYYRGPHYVDDVQISFQGSNATFIVLKK